MKSVGEAMAIGRTFRESFAKAMRSRELDAAGRPARATTASCSTASRRPPRTASTSCSRPSAAGLGVERAPRADRDRPLVPPRARAPRDRGRRHRGARPHLQAGRHLRGGVRGADAVLLLGRRARARRRPGPGWRPGARGPGLSHSEVRRGERPERRHPRLRPEPDRPGDRVRLLLRARGDDGARVRPRRGDGQLQPGDGLDRLRHLRPPLLRAAHGRGRARRDRAGAARGRDRPVRRPDAAAACQGARGGGREPARHAGRRDRPGRGPRPLRGAAAPPRDRPPAVRHRAQRRGGAGDRRAGRLPAARPALLRARRPGDGDLLLGRGPRRLPRPARQGEPRAPAAARSLPRGRDRGRRRRALRRHRLRARRRHAARRGGGGPLRRLGLRAAADEPRPRDARADRGDDAHDRARARRDRADQHPVRGRGRASST